MTSSSSDNSRPPLVALVGNPNTGKTSVFNALCGTRQQVGNYPGVTVEKKTGSFDWDGQTIQVVDLPGLYSLNPLSPDEQVATDGILAHAPGMPTPDLLIFVADSTNLKRNLLLYSQIADTQKPVIAVITMMDLLDGEGVQIDIDQLGHCLNIPMAVLTKGDAKQVQQLKNIIGDALDQPPIPTVCLAFEPAIGSMLDDLQHMFPQISRFDARALLFGSQNVRVGDPMLGAMQQKVQALREQADSSNLTPAALVTQRYQWAEAIVQRVEKRSEKALTFSRKLDRILTHRFFGLIIFAAVMFLMFQSIYTWAVPFMDLIETGISTLSDVVGSSLAARPLLASIMVDGMIAGVGSVIVFLPQIVILFLFVAVLEDSGYLSRAAFLMDKLLGWTGLNGRAFIPMLSSFACAVPGIMAARVMPDPKARMATILVSPLMSCSARLPVYILLISAFIEPRFGASWAAVTLFAMHGIGLLIALPIAWILNKGILKTPDMPFILELPVYRLPNWTNVVFRAYEAGKKFTVRAGTVIFAFSIIIWALSYFPRPDHIADDIRAQAQSQDALLIDQQIAGAYLEQSYLGTAGKAIQPIFGPLGFDWKITVGILGAFPAREVILSTLGIIYQIGEADEESDDLKQRMAAESWPDGSQVFTPLVAIVLMIFFALCSQCMSTLITVQRELNSWKWAGFLFTYMTALAYLLSLVTYQGGKALGLG